MNSFYTLNAMFKPSDALPISPCNIIGHSINIANAKQTTNEGEVSKSKPN